jgi:hypothetical protein
MHPPLATAILLMLMLSITCLHQPAQAGLAPSLKPHQQPGVGKHLDPDEVVRFTKSLYKDLGNSWNNATAVADKYRDKFLALNATTEGQITQTLGTLFEIRMLDLQASVRHARRMREVVAAFTEKPSIGASI